MAILISLVTMLLLLGFMLKPKLKDPYPAGVITGLFVASALSAVISSLLWILVTAGLAVNRLGLDTVRELLTAMKTGEEATAEVLGRINASSPASSPLRVFISTFLTAGLLEELVKFAAFRIATSKLGCARTWMDVVTCCSIVGLGFEVFENFLYTGRDNVILALLRSVTPMHFCLGVIMGYFYGSFLVKGEKADKAKALLVPVLIHTLFDTGLNFMHFEDGFLWVFGPAAFLCAIVLAVVTIVRVLKWRKAGTLEVPVNFR